MNRPWQTDLNANLLNRIRDLVPDSVLRTTLIVGFPGETEDEFEHLASFVEAQQFDHVGVFTFSSEIQTPAAELPKHISWEIAQARKDKLMSIQQPISEKLNRNSINKIMDVLIESKDLDTGEMVGRCFRFAPEVDGQVLIESNSSTINASIGDMVPVLITGSNVYDLTGKIIGAKELIQSSRAI